MSSEVQIAVIDQQDTQIVLAVPGVQGATGSEIAAGGTANQVLRKASSTNYDTNWSLVTNAMVDSSAAIAGTKISPDFGSQNSVTTGTSTAASFIPTSSTAPTNGVYLPSANNVAISTNGTGRLFVDASGNISIGTSSLTTGVGRTYLTIGGSTLGSIALKNASNAEVLYVQTGAASVDYYMSVAGYQAFWTNNTECMRLDSSGRVGIGTGASTPGGTLEVKAATSVAPFVASGPSSEYARIDSSGRLLVGTSSTSATFTTVLLQGSAGDAAAQSVLRLARGASTPLSGNALGVITFSNSAHSSGAEIYAARDGGTWSASSLPTALVFSVTADGASSPTEAMRIKNSRIINIANTPVYADNAAAKTGGLVDGDVYRTSTGDLKIVYT
jgi:hypothetical protein